MRIPLSLPDACVLSVCVCCFLFLVLCVLEWELVGRLRHSLGANRADSNKNQIESRRKSVNQTDETERADSTHS